MWRNLGALLHTRLETAQYVVEEERREGGSEGQDETVSPQGNDNYFFAGGYYSSQFFSWSTHYFGFENKPDVYISHELGGFLYTKKAVHIWII